MSNDDAISRGSTLCSYAALILYDENLEVTSENLTKLIKASNNSVAPFLPSLFAKVLSGVDIKALLVASAVGSGGGTSTPPSATDPGMSGKVEVKPADEPEPVVEEESDDDIGFSLFD